MDSREFWMFIGALTLLISGLQITLSTSYPVFNKLFGPEGLITLYDQDKVLSDPIEHYNAIQVPFAIIIVLLIGVGQFLSYHRTSTQLFFKRQIATLVITTILTVLSSWALDMWNPMYILLLWTLLLRHRRKLRIPYPLGKRKLECSRFNSSTRWFRTNYSRSISLQCQ